LEQGRWLSTPISTAGLRTTAPQVICDHCQSFWDLSAGNRWAVYGEKTDTQLAVREVATGKSFPLFNWAGSRIGRVRLSPDDHWMAFTVRKGGTIKVHVAPFHPGSAVGVDEVIPITLDDTYASAPTWSPDGSMIYYVSNRDGYVCVWAQRVDRVTGRPLGVPFAVWHFHEPGQSMSLVPLPTRAIAVSRDRIVVTATESTGNIWVSRRP